MPESLDFRMEVWVNVQYNKGVKFIHTFSRPFFILRAPLWQKFVETCRRQMWLTYWYTYTYRIVNFNGRYTDPIVNCNGCLIEYVFFTFSS